MYIRYAFTLMYVCIYGVDMCMSVCGYVYLSRSVLMYVCLYVCMYVCILCIYVCMFLIYLCRYVLYVCMIVFTYVNMYVCMCLYYYFAIL